MSEISDARTEVDGLNKITSPPSKFVKAYVKIVAAGKVVKEAERMTLRTIVKNFIDKIPIPVGASFQDVEESAQKFFQDLSAAIIGTGMANIAARNAELLAMAGQLGIQITAIDASANTLPKIKENIDKATAAVTSLKTLVSTFSSADANTKAKIDAVIKALNELKTTFSAG